MKKQLIILSLFCSACLFSFAQKSIHVPAAVKSGFQAKYPDAHHVTWEKEKGNYEGNWGGKSGEDHSAMFTPKGEFIELVNAISVSELPAPVVTYVKSHYKGAKITEAGRVIDAKGKISYEAEVNHKDVIFDEKGNFVKREE